jgi:uncharacterized membrane protein
MFGMLDYRAHKLFWLLTLPLRIISRLLGFALIVVAILIARWTEYSPLVQIVIGIAAFEGMGFIFGILWLFLVALPIEKIFFWTVDVVPSHGEDEEEAKEIVRKGPIIWLTKKLMNHIDDWTYEDTNAFVSCMNWRARLFFNEKERFWKRVEVLHQLYDDTGKQPSSLPEAEVLKLLKPYKAGWLQIGVVNYFNDIMAVSIIVVAILYLSSGQ